MSSIIRVNSRVTYQIDTQGMRELGKETFIGQACVEGAKSVRDWARANDPSGDYEARAEVVRAGRENQNRRGAVVEETQRGKGHFKRTLARAAQEARSYES